MITAAAFDSARKGKVPRPRHRSFCLSSERMRACVHTHIHAQTDAPWMGEETQKLQDDSGETETRGQKMFPSTS